MEQHLGNAFNTWALLYLSGLAAASLFFAMAGFREVKENIFEGLLFLALAVFFACAHIFLLFNTTPASYFSQAGAPLNLWGWLVLFLAPALIGLYLLFGLFNFISARSKEGMIKIFFGLTLVCYLYLLGSHWPIDVKGILTLTWGGIWFNVELKTAL